MLSRRELVGKVAAGTAAVAVASVASKSLASTPRDFGTTTRSGGSNDPQAQQGKDVTDSGPPQTLSAPAPWGLVSPLAIGSAVANGWRVAGLTGAVDGSCVLTLRNEHGREHRVHICRNDGNPQGLVYTKHFDLVVMNGGRGDLPTEESAGQAVAKVAHILAANENDFQQQPIVTALLPHAERLRMCGAADRRLR